MVVENAWKSIFIAKKSLICPSSSYPNLTPLNQLWLSYAIWRDDFYTYIFKDFTGMFYAKFDKSRSLIEILKLWTTCSHITSNNGKQVP